MFQLKEIWRQTLAGLFAAGAFSVVYLLLSLKWLPALAIAFAVYIALILLIERAPEDYEILVHKNLNQDDVNKSIAYFYQANKKLRQVSHIDHVDDNTSTALRNLAELVKRIADNYRDDPGDLKRSIPLIKQYLPRLLDIVDNFEKLSKKTSETAHLQARLDKIATTIQTYVPHFEAIYEALLENDFKRLELESEVLGDVMKMQTRH
jgi:5-bromo-4-chloroindolyl phosphate hydrolysis protein